MGAIVTQLPRDLQRSEKDKVLDRVGHILPGGQPFLFMPSAAITARKVPRPEIKGASKAKLKPTDVFTASLAIHMEELSSPAHSLVGNWFRRLFG